MHALYILTVQSAYNSSVVYSPESYTGPLWKAVNTVTEYVI